MGPHFISISHFRSVGRLMMWHQLTNNFSDANKTSKDVSCSSGIQSVKGRHKLTVPTISFSELNASPGHLSESIQILCSQTLRNVFVFVTTQNLKYQDLDFDFLSFSNAKKKKKIGGKALRQTIVVRVTVLLTWVGRRLKVNNIFTYIKYQVSSKYLWKYLNTALQNILTGYLAKKLVYAAAKVILRTLGYKTNTINNSPTTMTGDYRQNSRQQGGKSANCQSCSKVRWRRNRLIAFGDCQMKAHSPVYLPANVHMTDRGQVTKHMGEGGTAQHQCSAMLMDLIADIRPPRKMVKNWSRGAKPSLRSSHRYCIWNQTTIRPRFCTDDIKLYWEWGWCRSAHDLQQRFWKVVQSVRSREVEELENYLKAAYRCTLPDHHGP